MHAVFRSADFRGYVQQICYVHLKIQVKVEGPVFFFIQSSKFVPISGFH